jgi:hypothetical protein
MTININEGDLIDKIRYQLSQISIDMADDIIIHSSLEDSYEYIQMIVDEDVIEEWKVKRCLINLCSYDTYRNYCTLAEVENTLPETATLNLSTLLMKAYRCLSLISKYSLNEDLSIKDSTLPIPAWGSMSYSLIK